MPPTSVRRALLLTLAAVGASAPLLLDRIGDLELRVLRLEQGGRNVPDWSAEQIEALWTACGDLLRGPASARELLPRWGTDERFGDAIWLAGSCLHHATEAREAHHLRKPRLAALHAQNALDRYNEAARILGIAERER